MDGAQEIAVGAKVECTDGPAGRLTNVIINPVRQRVTHLVVEGDASGVQGRLVPLERVAAATRETVRLRCTLAELNPLPEFYDSRYVPSSPPEAQPVIAEWQNDMNMSFTGYPTFYEPYVMPADEVPVSEEHLPAGEISFYRGSSVESGDGKEVGTVEEFIISPKDQRV